ncbi:unnamed protein product [Linum tenue]|uniref:Uncharacterized protein n=1 Tax=Linum tenue TaxID=586396 RepID=A0AAV0NXV9_9ROSI|nr:unnamed protein product [Linum tenue]
MYLRVLRENIWV